MTIQAINQSTYHCGGHGDLGRVGTRCIRGSGFGSLFLLLVALFSCATTLGDMLLTTQQSGEHVFRSNRIIRHDFWRCLRHGLRLDRQQETRQNERCNRENRKIESNLIQIQMLWMLPQVSQPKCRHNRNTRTSKRNCRAKPHHRGSKPERFQFTCESITIQFVGSHHA